MRGFNLYFLDYAIKSLLNQRYKTIFSIVVLSSLVFLLSSIFFMAESIKKELELSVDLLPQIIVQNIKAGKHYDIDVSVVDDLLEISGVEGANARVWGYYYFENGGVNFSIVGIDEYETQYKKSLESIANVLKFDTNSMMIGEGVLKTLKSSHYDEYFNFIKQDGSLKKMNLGGVFKSQSALESNDMIVMSKSDAREIFDMSEDKATDIVLSVANKDEISTISSKIKLKYPQFRVITNNDLKISYQNIFDYKSGLFLALFVVAIFTFFIIIYDKASGLSSEQKREVGILRAIGWSIDDILKARFYEAFLVSFFSYLLGITLAFGYVYILKAPLLRDIFSGYSQLRVPFKLMFVFDIKTLLLIFFLSIPIYIASIIIPSWQSATLEVDEVLR